MVSRCSLPLRLGVAALAALTLLVGPASAGAKTSPAEQAVARVRTVLTNAESAGAVAAPDVARYRASLRQTMSVLRALDTPSKRSRYDQLAAQLVTMAAIADRGALTAERFPALFHQLDANRIWFAAKGPPGALSRVHVGADPIVYGYFPGSGLVIHPLFNWSQANSYWFAKDYARMQQLIDALAPLVVPQPGGWATWEYLFDYGNGKAPWRSAMPHAVAMQALVRASQATGNPGDLALAQRLAPGLGVPTTSGGLLSPDGSRWWPLYSFDPGLRVLNGDLQVLVSLYDYAN